MLRGKNKSIKNLCEHMGFVTASTSWWVLLFLHLNLAQVSTVSHFLSEDLPSAPDIVFEGRALWDKVSQIVVIFHRVIFITCIHTSAAESFPLSCECFNFFVIQDSLQ